MEKIADTSYRMGICYYRGTNGYPLDHEKAFRFISAAAKAGNDEATHLMGVMYKNGEGIQQNLQLAIDCFNKALQLNSSNGYAAFDLGRMYYFGTGVEKNHKLAFDLLDRAIGLGLNSNKSYINSACYFVGCILMDQKKNRESVKYFMYAAEKGHIPQAYHNLGWLCELGAFDDLEKTKIPAAAMEFYKEAANLGFAQSMDAVGRIYASVNMLNEAKEWIQKAADRGYEPAKKRLKYLKVAESGHISDLFFS